MRTPSTVPHPLALSIAIALTAAAAAPAHAQRLVVDDGSEQVADGQYETTVTGEAGRALWATNPGSTIVGRGITASTAASNALVADAQGRITLTDATLRSSLESGFVAWADTGGTIELDGSRFELTPATNSATAPGTALGATAGGSVRMTGGSIQSTGARVARAIGAGSAVTITGVTIAAGVDPHVEGAFRAEDGGIIALEDVRFEQPTNTAKILHAEGDGSRIEVANSQFSVDRVRIRDWNGRDSGGAVYARDGGSILLGPGTVVTSKQAGSGLAGAAQAVSVFAVDAGSHIHLDGAFVDAAGDLMVGAAAVGGATIVITGDATLRTDGSSSGSAGLLADGQGSVITMGAARIDAGRHGGEARNGGRIEAGAETRIAAQGTDARGLVAINGGQLRVDGAHISATGHRDAGPVYGIEVRGGRDGDLAPSVAGLGRGTRVDTDGVGLVVDAGQALQNLAAVWVRGEMTADGTTVVGADAGAAVLRGSALASTDSSIEGGSRYALRVYDDGAHADVTGGRLALTDAAGDDAAAIQVRHGTVRLSGGVDVSSSNGVLILDPGDGFGRDGTHVSLDDVQLAGDLVTRHRDRSNVTLENGSGVVGAMTGSRLDPDSGMAFALQRNDAHGWNVDIDATGSWRITGDSDIRSLQLAGDLAFSAPEHDGFKTLVVYGDYAGNGGTLTFNARLGGDDTPSDRLIVGGSTSGTTGVEVLTAGGAGAPTVEGIQLIRVDGASDGRFTLQGRAVAGNYDYFLHQGGTSAPDDGHWYLRSELDEPAPEPEPEPEPEPGPGPGPDPGPGPEPGPPPGPLPPPVYRPEPGIYLANLAAADLFAHSLHERQGEPAFRAGTGGSAWARIARSQFTADTGAGQIESSTHAALLQVGSDIAHATFAGGEAVAGVMLSTGHANTRANSNRSGYHATGQLRGQMAGLYATWRDPARAGTYLDGWLQYGNFRNTAQGDYLSTERYDSRAWSVSLEAGHAIELGRSEHSAWYLQPQAQLIHTRHLADDHTEANGSRVEFVEGQSLIGRVGARVYSRALADVSNQVQPYAGLHWRHINGDYTVALDGEQIALRQPDNVYELNLGLQMTLGSRWTGWSQIGWQRGDGEQRTVTGLLGVHYRW